MKRYLLFDSGCCGCSKIAKSIEQEAGDKLTIRNLRDPEVREMLDRELPKWKWEPMLVEEKNEKVRIYTGRALSRRLLLVLGPRRALHITEMMGAPLKKQTDITGRRAFLRQGTTLLALGALLPGIMKNDLRSGVNKDGFVVNDAHLSLKNKGIPLNTEIDESVKSKIRKAVINDPAFKYMYFSSTKTKRFDEQEVTEKLEVVGYLSGLELYLIGLKFSNELEEDDSRSQRNEQNHVLVIVYDDRRQHVLSVVSAKSIESENLIDLHFKSIDSKIHAQIPRQHLDTTKIVSFEHLHIDTKLANRVGYTPERQEFLAKRGTNSSSIAPSPDTLKCDIVCHIVGALLCDWINPLICTIVSVIVCMLVCTDPVY